MQTLRLFAVLLCGLVPMPALSQVTDVSQAMRVEPVVGWRQADGTHVAALRFRLAPGWKTYWRSAGAAGISPQMDWRGSRGARSVTPAWPTPIVFGPVGRRSIGYDRDFVLPLLVAVEGNGTVRLRGRLDLGVCADVCLPARIDVAVDLLPGGRPDPAIESALADRPARVRAPARCRIGPTAQGLSLGADIDVASQGEGEVVVFEVPDPSVWVSDAAGERDGGVLRATAELLAEGGRPQTVDRSRIRITVIGSRGAVEIEGCAG